VHNLADSAVALVYCNDSKAGPAEIIAVLPANRRSLLREEFAFEFLAFARFLGAISVGAELQVHDAIACAIAGRHDREDVVISISSLLWPEDLDFTLSRCVEKVVVTLCRWLNEHGVQNQANEDPLPAATA
jgi:hypothetical protein